MPSEFDPAAFDPDEITPESIKAEMKAALAGSLAEADGLDVDTREGSYTDLLYSEAAYQMYKIYAWFPALLSVGIPSQRSGAYLDDFAGMFGLSRAQGTRAAVRLTFSGVDGTEIPAGTVAVSVSGLRYDTLEDAVIQGGTAEVDALAEEIGDACNLGPGTIVRLLVNLAGVVSVTNAQAVGGTDTESDSSLYQRLHTFLSEPVASGNANHYKQWARSVAGVGYVAVLPLWNGSGTVKVIIAGTDKGPLDGAVVSAVAAKIEQERPIGAAVTVVSVTALPVTVAAQCTLEEGVEAQTVQDQLEQRLQELLLSLEVGAGETIRYNRVLATLLALPGVVDCTSLQLNGGTGSITLGAEQVPQLGDVTVTKGA